MMPAIILLAKLIEILKCFAATKGDRLLLGEVLLGMKKVEFCRYWIT